MSSNKLLKQLIYQIIDNKIDKIKFIRKFFKNITDDDFDILLSALKLNKSIKKINFMNVTLSQKNFEKFCDFMQNNTNITTLYITHLNSVFNVVNSKYSNNINFYKYLDDMKKELNNCKCLNNCIEYINNIDYFNNIYNNLLEDILNNNMSSVFNMIINNKSLRKIRFELDDYNLFSKVLCKNNNINYINSKHIVKGFDFIIDILNNNNNITTLNTYLMINDYTYNNNNSINLYNNFINFCKTIETNQSLQKIKITGIKEQFISDDIINDVISMLFNSLIKNKSIKYIKFKNGIIRDHLTFDYNMFINLLQNNNRIEELYIKYNKFITDECGCKFIGFNKFLEYLQFNKTLKRLQLPYNEDVNTKLLALIIKNNKTLEYLNISKLNVTNLDLFFEYLKENTTLKILNLKKLTIPFIKENINEVLQYNKNINIIYEENNPIKSHIIKNYYMNKKQDEPNDNDSDNNDIELD